VCMADVFDDSRFCYVSLESRQEHHFLI